MAIPNLTDPVVAENIAAFGDGEAGTASKINYNVPLPGVFSSDQITPLTIPSEWFQNNVASLGTSLLQLGIVQGAEGGAMNSIDTNKLSSFYNLALPMNARPSLRLAADVGGDVFPLFNEFNEVRKAASSELTHEALLQRRRILAEPEDVDVQRARRASYIEALVSKVSALPQPSVANKEPRILLPVPGFGHSIQHVWINPVAPPIPHIALVETWEIRSYLGDYGLGRTLQTFSLLPGEKTTITVETWRNDSARREDASSVFDSSDVAAQTRFSNAIASETGSAFQSQDGWNASAATSAKGSFSILYGLVSASADPFDANYSTNHQESSQRWSRNLSQSANEHASQVNNSRQQAVQSTSETTTASGSATTTVREISNINLRRVLNFVFRELNQSFDTYVVLRDIKLGFYNGYPGSLEVVPLPEIQRFIEKYIVAEHQEEAARRILALTAERIDADGEVVSVLQVGEREGGSYHWQDMYLDKDGQLDFDDNPMSHSYRWRFRPGILTDDPRKIEGVITTRSSIVLRTDNLVVEALLGQADALDPYASALQAIDLESREQDIASSRTQMRRTQEAFEIISETPTDERVAAYRDMLVPQPEIEVVPVASVQRDDGGHP